MIRAFFEGFLPHNAAIVGAIFASACWVFVVLHLRDKLDTERRTHLSRRVRW